jgi:putative ubiquitin-RnfH superfamily antitoxin RatB of RatAB toxin-antitoxin module
MSTRENATDHMISIEVAYATPELQKILSLQVAPGTTARQAAMASNIQQFFPEADIAGADMGIFGKTVKADQYVLNEGDRVEIYRPLIADPKEVRKARAAKLKSEK